jgi:hypothetical protein
MAEIRVNATGAVKFYDNDDSNFVGLQAGSISSDVTFTLPTADGSNGQFLKTDGSGALSFGSVSSSGAYDLNGGELVLDADADTSITADTDDQIDIRIAGADDFQFTANTFTAQSGSTIAAQALTATTVTASGILKTDDATEATSTTDGSLQTDGGLSVVKDAVFGDDVSLLSDAAVLNFGADKDVSVTHVADTGLKISSAQSSDKELLTLESTQAGANGPFIKFNHNTASAADDDIAGALDFYNNDDGGNSTQVGKIEVKMTDASNGSENSIISFSNNVAGTFGEAMRVGETGNVGIGETNPQFAKLQINQATAGTLNQICLRQDNNGGGDKQVIRFIRDTDESGSGAEVAAIIGEREGGNDTALVFKTDTAGGGNSTEHFRINAGGDLTATDTSIGSNSDQRLKENIADYNYDIDTFKTYKVKSFDWKNPARHRNKTGQIGFIAQDVESIDSRWLGNVILSDENDPDYSLISADGDGNRIAKTLKLGENDAMYISIIQQSITKIETLEAEMTALKARVTTLEG